MNRFSAVADPFVPHEFGRKVELMGGVPRVLVTRAAYSRMWHYVDIGDEEVGWLGTAERLPSGDFLIGEVFLLEQEVHATTTEISAEGVAALAEELITSRPDGVEMVSSIRFWGHSHVRMGTSPSGQDEFQMRLFRENECDWFVRGIFNKLGRAQFDIFLYKEGVIVRDAAWAIFEPVDTGERTQIEAEFSAKVRPKKYSASEFGFGRFGGGEVQSAVIGHSKKKGGRHGR